MPGKEKHKTHKGAAKRLRGTKNRKLRHKKAGMGHLMSHKSGKRRRQLGKQGFVGTSLLKTYRTMLGI